MKYRKKPVIIEAIQWQGAADTNRVMNWMVQQDAPIKGWQFHDTDITIPTLESCPIHDFSICLDRHTKKPIENPTPAQRFGAYWGCRNCQGRVDGLARIWYDRGLKDASK